VDTLFSSILEIRSFLASIRALPRQHRGLGSAAATISRPSVTAALSLGLYKTTVQIGLAA
jgi:hypothetical protein